MRELFTGEKAIEINSILTEHKYSLDENGIFSSGNQGYWSNFDRETNEKFIQETKANGPEVAIDKFLPKSKQIIFSKKREAALELLDVTPGDICLDYGCMWGALSIGMANRGGRVVSIDQTYDSLRFLKERIKFDGVENITLVQDDIKKANLPEFADKAVINGVLEWVPQVDEVALKDFYGKREKREGSKVSPDRMQSAFLRRVCSQLKPKGQLLLTIENRYDYTQFFGKPDPHANIRWTSILPRPLANLLSKIKLNRPYVNYLYSFPALKKMVLEAGFTKVELYSCFPDYRFPELILPYEGGAQDYRMYKKFDESTALRTKLKYYFELFLIKKLRASFFAPSIVLVATK